MKVLQISPYWHVQGGSDRYFLAICRLLEKYGHTVIPWCTQSARNEVCEWSEFFVRGVDTEHPSIRDVGHFLYSTEARAKLRALLRRTKPELAHLHIYYGQFSASILSVLKEEWQIPVVQTVHDYKPVCPVYSLFRDGDYCEACHGKRYWKAILHRCNRGSFPRSVLSATEAYVSRWLGAQTAIDRFVAVSLDQSQRLSRLGIPRNKIAVLGNFIADDLLQRETDVTRQQRVVCMGRLEREKGIFEVLEVASLCPNVEFVFAGGGGDAEELSGAIRRRGLDNVSVVGFVAPPRLAELTRASLASICLSRLPETFGLSVLESLAVGTPVVAAKSGALPELVKHGQWGFLVNPGDVQEAARYIGQLAEEPARVEAMGNAAKAFALRRFGAASHYEGLMEIYRSVERKVNPLSALGERRGT